MPDNAATIAKLSDSEGDAARVEESKKLSFDSSEDDASSGEDGEEGPDFVAISRLHPEYTSGAHLAGFSSASTLGAVDRASEERVPRRDGVVRPWLNYAPPIRGKATAQNVDMEEVCS